MLFTGLQTFVEDFSAEFFSRDECSAICGTLRNCQNQPCGLVTALTQLNHSIVSLGQMRDSELLLFGMSFDLNSSI